MSDDPPFVASERAAAQRLQKLQQNNGPLYLRKRNEIGEIAELHLGNITPYDEEAILALADLKGLRI